MRSVLVKSFAMGVLLAAALVPASAWAAGTPQPPSPKPSASTLPAGLGISSLRLPALGRHAGSTTRRYAQPLIACGANWRVVDSQGGTWNNVLGGIAAVSPTDIWAVGNSESPTPAQFGNGDQNLAEHWDGMAWSTVPVPQNGSDANDLNDVAAVSTNDVWAVGFENSTNNIQGTAFHWNGSVWAATQGAVSLGSDNLLNDVVAFGTNDVWAVGGVVGGNGLGVNVGRTLVEHYDGTSWSVKVTPNLGTGDNSLFGVGGTSSNDLYAVGYARATTSASRQALVLHSTDGGSTWSTASPSNDGLDKALTSVAANSTTDAMVVGYYGSSSFRTLADHSVDGTNWTDVSTTSLPDAVNVLGDVAPVSPSSFAAVGFSAPTSTSAASTFTGAWGGSSWSYAGAANNGTGDNAFSSLAVAAPGDDWGVGFFTNPQNITQNLVENLSGLAAPTGVSATAGDQSAQVTWAAPCSDGGSGITQYVVTAHDGCTIQGSETVTGAPPATTLNYTGLTNGTGVTFTVAAYNGFGLGPQSATSAAVTPNGATPESWVTACSPLQYTLSNSNGSTWVDMDSVGNLTATFTPSVDSIAVMTANADLWTSNAGYNQDLGIAVSGGGVYPRTAGQPEAWKESGGFAGTFSPNAAAVETAIPVIGGTNYSAKLQWKASHSDPGTIAAGAGSSSTGFSPTRLTVRLIPNSSAQVFTKSTTAQYHLTGSNGSTWQNVDTANLAVPFTVGAGSWTAFISGNADLWTSSAGYNQDIGIALSGPGFPTALGQPESWKESGGFAGTFSPNAAFVSGQIGVTPGSYTATLQWKANHSDPGTIWAGAGPIGRKYSPTSVTVIVVPASAAPQPVSSNLQFPQVNSDGTYWQSVDSSLKFGITPSPAESYLISGNVDLWTSVAGYNQDIGIMVSGGAYGPGTLVAWKESGGLAGTFSPNAAFVSTALHLQAGIVYSIWLVWKANQPAHAQNAIYIGAGPIGGRFSPTWLTAEPLSTP